MIPCFGTCEIIADCPGDIDNNGPAQLQGTALDSPLPVPLSECRYCIENRPETHNTGDASGKAQQRESRQRWIGKEQAVISCFFTKFVEVRGIT